MVFALVALVQPTQAAVVGSVVHGDTAYFLHDSPARLGRYDMTSRLWLSDIVLPVGRGTPSVFHVDADGIYVAYGTSLYRYDGSGGGELHLLNAPQTIQAVHADGNLLFVNHSSSIYARFISIDKTTNSQIATFEKYVDSVYGSSIAPSANKLLGRSLGISPGDITFVSYTDSGTFVAGGNGPYHGDYPSATRTWVLPGDSRVLDNSGTVYNVGDLTYAGSLGGAFTDIAFQGAGGPVVLRGTALELYSASLLPVGLKTLAYTPFRIFINGSDVITFSEDAGEASGILERVEPMAELVAPVPGMPVDPIGLAFTPDLVFQDVNGVVCLFHKATQSIFRWDPATQQYLPTIPLIGSPAYAAYSPTLHRVYLGYASGVIRKIDLSDPSFDAPAFFVLPSATKGLAAAGDYLLAVDATGVEDTHYTVSPAGGLVDSLGTNYYSAGYTWSDANQKMYFFRDSVSPNDILWEEINANGTAYPGEVQGGIRNRKDSPYHGQDSFVHPIRVAPDGSVVVTGTGNIYDATTLVREASVLPNSIADASWIGSELRTIRTITGVTQYQQWTGATRELGLVKQYPGSAIGLLTHSGTQLVGISTATDGRPSFYLLDSTFEVVAPPTLAQPGFLERGNVSPSQVSFSWADVSGETRYEVERKVGVGGSWSFLGTTTVSETSFTDSSVTVGFQYFYRVTAANGSLLSAPSDELAVSVTPPPVPSPLMATPVSSSAISLTWPDVEEETGYKVERATSESGPWVQIFERAANVTSLQVGGLGQSTTYFFRVRSTNAIGDSAYTNTASATTLQAPPSAPVSFRVHSNSFVQTVLRWNDTSFESEYVLERGPAFEGPWAVLATLPANTIEYIDTTISPSTLYYYRIKAVNAAGSSAYSTISNTTPAPQPPGTPSNVALRVVSMSEMSVTWSAALHAGGYIVERRTANPLSWMQVGDLDASETSFADTSVVSGTQYWYRVTAYNSYGSSAASVEVTGVPVELYAVVEDDFDPNYDSGVWSTISSGVAVNGGTGFLGSKALWFGSSGTRLAETRPLELTEVAYLEFKLRAGNQTADGASYWNNSENGETLVIEYTLDGVAWSQMAALNTVYPNYSTWTSQFMAVPEAAVSPTTQFRWRQLSHSGGTNDAWALEDIRILTGLPLVPDAPPFIIASPNSASSIAISWVAPARATGCVVERSVDGTTWIEIAATPAGQNYHTDTDLLPDSWYQYRVRGTNAGGNSAPSATSLVATLSRIAEWRLANYGTTSASGPSGSEASGDDGIQNLAKFAFNMNVDDGVIYVEPGVGSKGLPTTRLDPISRRLRVEFIRRKSSSNPGITYQVEFCSALDCFAPSGNSVQVTSVDDLLERVVWEDSVSIDDVDLRFARVTIIENP